MSGVQYLLKWIMRLFERFAWYLEPVDHEPDTYVVKSLSPRMPVVKQNRITFVDSLGIGTPLPDPRHLALHASVARTFAHSGVGRYYVQMALAKARRIIDETSSEEEPEREEESGQNVARKKNGRKRRG